MNNVQHLLDSYGPPPSEVCLDWAYQLLRLAQESHSSTSASWTSLQVNKNGQLSLSTDRTSHEQSVAVLVQQLLEWSKRGVNSEATHQSISMNDATKSEIHQELLQMMRELQAPLSARNSMLTEKVNVVDAADLTANQLDSPRLLSAAPTASPTGSPSTTSRKAKSKQLSRTMIFGVASLLAVVSTIAFFLWPRSSQIENRLASQAPLPSIADHAQVELAGSPNEELAILAGTPEDHSSLLSPQETTQSSIGLSLSGPIGGLSSVQSNPSSAPNQPPSPSDSPNPTDTKNSAPTEAALPSVPELPSVPALSENPSSDQSVESMLAEAAKAEPKINDLDTEVNASGIPQLPTQLLDIESMLQVQEITAKIRIRQPLWQLRIATTDEFTVHPAEMQSLSEKQTISWTLNAKELKLQKGQEPTKVVVFAQLAGRKADIKWKIVAGCDDLPNIVVPLNVERLDLMLTMLQSYQQRLSSGVSTIKASMELPGIPREQKTILTAQRKVMERESTLVSRARQIIADASLFVGWMDRSLEMHGNLIDQFGNQDTKLLQIGQPELSNSSESSTTTTSETNDVDKP